MSTNDEGMACVGRMNKINNKGSRMNDLRIGVEQSRTNGTIVNVFQLNRDNWHSSKTDDGQIGAWSSVGPQGAPT